MTDPISHSSPMSDAAQIEQLQSELAIARNFPSNTTPASRHLELIADSLAAGERYMMLEEEPKHCAITIYSVLLGFYRSSAETATQVDRGNTLFKACVHHQERADAAEARLADAVEVIQFAHDGYENQDVNHVDYRLKVHQACLDYLEKHPRSGAVGQQQDSGAD